MSHDIDLLTDAFSRIHDTVHHTLDGLSEGDLAFRPGGTGNPIGWLVWHLARVQDDHVADAAGSGQVWSTAGWFDLLGLPFPESATGYGMTSAQVDDVRGVTAEQLGGYLDAVHARTLDYLATLSGDDLERVVDTRWNPPVTLAVRLVSVIGDDLQHAGQAAYVRGLLA